MTRMQQLEECFLTAKECGMKYVAIKVEMVGYNKPEIIINDRDNFEKKIEYYKKAYNDELVLKSFDGIKIVDFCCGNNFESIEGELILYC